MKKILLPMLFMAGAVCTAAQHQGDDILLRISDEDMFSKCFVSLDANSDNAITYAEAAEATTLLLNYGGRLNIIEDYSFLKYFPNLTTLHVGNTTVEGIDMSHNPRLERVNLEQALWVRVIKFANGNMPQMLCPPDAKIMTILIGEDVRMPAHPESLNLEKHMEFSQSEIEEIR